MLLVRELAVLALLTVACSADGISQRFFFPSQQLLLETPDARADSGHGRRIPTSGDAAEGSSGSRPASSPSPANGAGGSAAPASSAGRVREPSRCTFAIVSCCRAGSIRIDEHCFGEFQCHGPFWGESPCRRESAVVAYNVVSKYYAAKEAEKKGEEATEAPGAGGAAAGEPEASSPFDPIGPLPSREEEKRRQSG